MLQNTGSFIENYKKKSSANHAKLFFHIRTDWLFAQQAHHFGVDKVPFPIDGCSSGQQ